MKTKQIIGILGLVVTLLLCSCKKETTIMEGNAALNFFPRECTQIITQPLRYTEETRYINGQVFLDKMVRSVGDEAVEADQFVLWTMTGAEDLKPYWQKYPIKKGQSYEAVYMYHSWNWQGDVLASPIPSLERQLREDYLGHSGGARSLGGGRDGKAMTNLIPWPYRVTGVKDFRIVSLSPLFGKPAETSLNDFFSIYEFKPRQVISYRTKQLLWGYQDKKELKNIAQWLSLEPMAPPVVMFRLNTRPEELPIKTQLVTILETTDGKTLRDTLEVQLK